MRERALCIWRPCCCCLLLQTWRYLVLDEGHRVRNMDTLTAKALRSVQRGNVLLLTGARLRGLSLFATAVVVTNLV